MGDVFHRIKVWAVGKEVEVKDDIVDAKVGKDVLLADWSISWKLLNSRDLLLTKELLIDA